MMTLAMDDNYAEDEHLALEPAFKVARVLLLILLRLKKPRSDSQLIELLTSEALLMALVADYCRFIFESQGFTNWESTYLSQAIDPLLHDDAAIKQKTIAYFNTARICGVRNSALCDLEILFNQPSDYRKSLSTDIADAITANEHRLPERVR